VPARLLLGFAWLLGTAGLRAAEAPAAAEAAFFDPGRLHHVTLTVPAAEWDVLLRETLVERNSSAGGGPAGDESDFVRADGRTVHLGGGFGGIFPWVRAEATVDGVAVASAGLRFKGNSSYNASLGSLHRNLKLKADQFGGRDTWGGQGTLNLNAGVLDASRVRESFSSAVFRAAGVPAPRAALAEVSVTVPGRLMDENLGLYTLVENVGTRFLRAAFPPGNGLLLKPEGARTGVPYLGEDWFAYVNTYRPERPATPAEQARVIEFARLVNLAPTAEFRERIGAFLEIEAFLRYLAVNALLVNHDSFLRGSHNFFIYLDPRDNRFRFIPWDQDLALAGFSGNSPGAELDVRWPWSTDNPLLRRLLDDPAIAARYEAILRDLATGIFTRERLFALLDPLEALAVAPLGAERAALARRGERFAGNPRFGHGPAPRDFLNARLAFVAGQLGLTSAGRP
jgi:spore coat protein H